jgi:hypothetical protein
MCDWRPPLQTATGVGKLLSSSLLRSTSTRQAEVQDARDAVIDVEVDEAGLEEERRREREAEIAAELRDFDEVLRARDRSRRGDQ